MLYQELLKKLELVSAAEQRSVLRAQLDAWSVEGCLPLEHWETSPLPAGLELLGMAVPRLWLQQGAPTGQTDWVPQASKLHLGLALSDMPTKRVPYWHLKGYDYYSSAEARTRGDARIRAWYSKLLGRTLTAATQLLVQSKEPGWLLLRATAAQVLDLLEARQHLSSFAVLDLERGAYHRFLTQEHAYTYTYYLDPAFTLENFELRVCYLPRH